MPKNKKKKKISYETKARRLREYRANLSDEKKQKIKEYNRMRSKIARASETPTEREKRLLRSRESARKRRSVRKAQVDKQMRKIGLSSRQRSSAFLSFPTRQTPLVFDPTNPLYNFCSQFNMQDNQHKSAVISSMNNTKNLGSQHLNKSRKEEMLPAELQFADYRMPMPLNMTPMNMSSMNMQEEYEDMATVCPIECNVDITPVPEPIHKFKDPINSVLSQNKDFVKNIGAHVVLKKKLMSNGEGASDDVRLERENGSNDWNGLASVCPIECNVDIADSFEPLVHLPPTREKHSSVMRRNTLLDNLKQMGTHVIIKKKGSGGGERNFSLRQNSSAVEMSRVLPIECNVDIKPIEARLKSSEITIVKRNGTSNNNIRKLGSQIVMEKIPRVVEEKGFESQEEGYDDYDLPCPIECNVDISESS